MILVDRVFWLGVCLIAPFMLPFWVLREHQYYHRRRYGAEYWARKHGYRVFKD